MRAGGLGCPGRPPRRAGLLRATLLSPQESPCRHSAFPQKVTFTQPWNGLVCQRWAGARLAPVPSLEPGNTCWFHACLCRRGRLWARSQSRYYQWTFKGQVSLKTCNSFLEVQFTYHVIHSFQVHNSASLVCSQIRAAITAVSARTFASCHKETPRLSAVTWLPSVPSPSALSKQHLLCVCKCHCSGHGT